MKNQRFSSRVPPKPVELKRKPRMPNYPPPPIPRQNVVLTQLKRNPRVPNYPPPPIPTENNNRIHYFGLSNPVYPGNKYKEYVESDHLYDPNLTTTEDVQKKAEATQTIRRMIDRYKHYTPELDRTLEYPFVYNEETAQKKLFAITALIEKLPEPKERQKAIDSLNNTKNGRERTIAIYKSTEKSRVKEHYRNVIKQRFYVDFLGKFACSYKDKRSFFDKWSEKLERSKLTISSVQKLEELLKEVTIYIKNHHNNSNPFCFFNANHSQSAMEEALESMKLNSAKCSDFNALQLELQVKCEEEIQSTFTACQFS